MSAFRLLLYIILALHIFMSVLCARVNVYNFLQSLNPWRFLPVMQKSRKRSCARLTMLREAGPVQPALVEAVAVVEVEGCQPP